MFVAAWQMSLEDADIILTGAQDVIDRLEMPASEILPLSAFLERDEDVAAS